MGETAVAGATAREARLEAWFRAYGDRVLAYLLHRTDAHTAQDVLQEVFVTAFRKHDEVPDPPLGWLFGTARRLLANTVRAERRRTRLGDRLAVETRVHDLPGPDDDPVGDLVVAPHGDDQLAEALATLSGADREVLTLGTWYGLDADEAATALGCSRAAYRVRAHRARRRLADALVAVGHPRATGPVAEGVS